MGYLSAHLQLAAGYKEHFCGKHSRVEIDWSQQEIKKLECANGRRLSMATAGDVAWSKQRRCDDEELPRFHYCTVPPALPSTEVARKLASKTASLATPDTTGSTLKRSRIKIPSHLGIFKFEVHHAHCNNLGLRSRFSQQSSTRSRCKRTTFHIIGRSVPGLP